MTVDTQITLKDYEGNAISQQVDNHVEKDGKKVIEVIKSPIPLKDILLTLLNAQVEMLSVDQKILIHEISLKLHSGNEVDFTDEEMKLIVERAGIVCTPLVFGRLNEIFKVDGKELN